MPAPMLPIRRLHRVRWAVRGTLLLGVAASVAANVLHARPDPVAQIIAAWPPLALLLTVELISRVPVHRRVLAHARRVATTGIAGIAAWVSYWHMAGVAARYGEAGASPYLLPLSVDGLIIVASVSLVEIAGRIRAADDDHTATTASPVPAEPPAVGVGPSVAPSATSPDPAPRPEPAARPGPDREFEPEPVPDPDHAAATDHAPTTGPHDDPADDPGLPDTPPDDPAAAIAYWHAKDPNLGPTALAEKVGRSRRTVGRILANPPDTTTPAVQPDRAARINGKTHPLAGPPPQP